LPEAIQRVDRSMTELALFGRISAAEFGHSWIVSASQTGLRQAGYWATRLVQTRYCYETGLKICLYRFRAAFRSVTGLLRSAKGRFRQPQPEVID
jgi:hypothetical protein